MAERRYATNLGAVLSLKHNLLWCRKYRREVLSRPVAERLSVLLAEVANETGAPLHAVEVIPDRVHRNAESDPRSAVARIAGRMKGRTSRDLRAAFPELRSRRPTLWSRSYHAGSVGHVSEATVRRYVADQKRR